MVEIQREEVFVQARCKAVETSWVSSVYSAPNDHSANCQPAEAKVYKNQPVNFGQLSASTRQVFVCQSQVQFSKRAKVQMPKNEAHQQANAQHGVPSFGCEPHVDAHQHEAARCQKQQHAKSHHLEKTRQDARQQRQALNWFQLCNCATGLTARIMSAMPPIHTMAAAR